MRLKSFILCIILLISSSLLVNASSPILVQINGNKLQTDVSPVSLNGRTLVPLRAIFEALGADVSWNANTKEITGTKDSNTIVLTVDQPTAKINGESKSLDVPPKIINGRTLVPLRFISEALGANVEWNPQTSIASISYNSSSRLKVYFIDVGQADSILIQSPDNKTMLIDAGNNSDSDTVINFIKSKGITKLDCVIATHPHEDHVGGMDKVIDAFNIGEFYMPKATANTKTYEDMLLAIKNKGLKIKEAKSGVNISFGSTNTSIIAPASTSYDDLNNYSAVIKMTYINKTFLFMGDAEAISEKEILSQGINIKADVLKVGHHGSSSSSSSEFLDKVLSDNSFAVISVGKANDYGHPHAETLTNLQNKGAPILRTDELGTIEIESDGNSITCNKKISPIKTTAPPITESAIYIGNKNTKKFHKETCSSLPDPKNQVVLKSREEAIAKGYDPCNKCKP